MLPHLPIKSGMAIIVKPQTESSVTADLAPWTLALD